MATEAKWLLLIHQLPSKPDYLRVKLWRRMQKIGAISLKNAVYVLPLSDSAYEDFEWTLRELVENGGEGTLCEARFVEGSSDEQITALFHAARDADYAQLLEETRHAESLAELAKVKKRFAEIEAIDFLEAPSRAHVAKMIDELEAKRARRERTATKSARDQELRGRTWVTRSRVHVDRMASAWLIKRFVDPAAKIKLVPGKSYKPEKGELRFDMFEGEYTHEGDHCTFETLLERCEVRDRGLAGIAEMIHDLDFKDDKFAREETKGIGAILEAIAANHKEDEERLARSAAIFDELYELLKKRRA